MGGLRRAIAQAEAAGAAAEAAAGSVANTSDWLGLIAAEAYSHGLRFSLDVAGKKIPVILRLELGEEEPAV